MTGPVDATGDCPGPDPEALAATAPRLALQRCTQALRLAAASLPHLAGLARLCRVKSSRDIEVAAVGPSGLIVIRPELFATMPLGDIAFVLAHELLHLALDTHGRIGDASSLLGNFAHDYIINDILCAELDRDAPPLGGLTMPGASEYSFEELMVLLGRNRSEYDESACWTSGADGRLFSTPDFAPPTTLGRALSDAGLLPPPPGPPRPGDKRTRLDRGDLLTASHEQALEPEISPRSRQRLREQVRQAAVKAASLAELKKRLQAAEQLPADQFEPGMREATLEAIHAAYNTPWQLALQRWFDTLAPGERTYARPSRRYSCHDGLILPGRQRLGWTLHAILDTSGSMEWHLGKALGALAYFCESAGVHDVHLVQCDIQVTQDDWIEPRALDQYCVRGFGFSDMTPAVEHLAADPEVTAAIIITDGFIDIPAEEPPFRILWVLIGEINDDFRPNYGEVVILDNAA